MNDRTSICHTCGKRRGIGEKHNDGWRETIWLNASGFSGGHMPPNHRPITWPVDHTHGIVEKSPQILVDLCIWRNGGRGDHICPSCIERALKELRAYLDDILG